MGHFTVNYTSRRHVCVLYECSGVTVKWTIVHIEPDIR